MRGEVEIWQGDKLLHKEDNMIMDGAGELLADIMTVSPSIARVVGQEALLDASNYTIQAISFGSGRQGYLDNAHYTTQEKNDLITSKIVTIDIPLGQQTQRVFVHLPTANPVYDSNGVSSYVPVAGLPTASNPTLTRLEPDTTVSGNVSVVSFGTTLLEADISGTAINSNQGQHMNMLPYANVSSYIENETEIREQIPAVFSAFSDSIMQVVYGQVGAALGCWPDSSAAASKVSLETFSGTTEENYDSSNAVTTITDVTGYFNSASSMDVSGHVNMIMSSVPHPGYQMSSGNFGLTISAAPDFSSTGEIVYDVNFASGDLIMANLYGGIYNIGLWAIDNINTIKSGAVPPYEFNHLNNPRKYKLFSRKTFNVNLTDIIDVT